MLAPLPHDEEDRLSELKDCGLFGTPPEPIFDRITRLAARIFQVPIALVSFVDCDHQWFKSRYGIDLTSTERDNSFCSYTILEPRTMIVNDASADPRFTDSPLVLGPPFVRFYAGAPITTERGHRLGTLCIKDTVPREFGAEQIAVLEDLAGMVTDELDRRMDPRRATPDELEAHCRSVFENAVGGLYQSLPGAGGFLNVNPAFATLLGYPSPDALIATLKDPDSLYVQPGRREEFVRVLDEAGIVTGMESEIFRADGTRVWVSENARAIRDAQGRLRRYEGSMEDVTVRRAAIDALQRAHEELEDRVHERTAELALFNGTLLQQIADRERAEENARRSEMKFRALVENAQDLTGIIAPEGVVLYITPSAEHLLGYNPDDLIGRDIFNDLVHPDDREELRAQFARIAEAGSRYVRSEARYRHRDGSWRLLESIASCAPPDFPIVSLVVNSRDITDRRRGEIEHETQVRLQTAVAELGRFALQGPDLSAIFDKSAGLITHALDIAFCTVTELLPGSQQLLIRAGRGWREEAVGRNVESWRVLGPDGNLVNPEPMVIENLRDLPRRSVLPYEAAHDDDPVCAVSVVIQSGGRSFGTICVLSAAPREFTPQDVTFLQTVADLLATLIQSKRQEDASREAEARYHRIVANLPGVVYQYCLHWDGAISFPLMSEGSRQLFGIEAAEVRRHPHCFADMIHPDDRAEYDAAGMLSETTLYPFEWEGRIRLPTGAVRWITARSRPERRGNGDIVWDGVMLDVSELKRAQETMREAKEEAEKANRAKSEFLSRMSHELRTPLNAILGFGQLLGLEDLAPVQASSVEQILRSGRHLLDLINEVLDIARIDEGSMEMNLERVDAGAMLTEAARFTRPLAEQHRVAFINGVAIGGFAVTADRGRLKQVLLNLFSNAVKFNREGGEVRFACETAPDGQTVRLAVSDTGSGLASDEVARLFTPFQRLNAGHHGIPGTGVGLAVAKSLVQAMGGTIGVQSEPGRGSTFFVDLPTAHAATPDAPPRAARFPDEPPTALLSPRTILHIDDQPANLSLLERVLETRADLRLIAAPDGRAGLALAREHRPDLILLDLHLPDIAGDEVLRRLHNEPATRDIPVIVLSADAAPGQMARLRQLGAREYVTKPFKINELLHTLGALLDPPRVPSAS